MATRFKSKGWSHAFENAKVALYVFCPVVTVVIFSQPEMVEKIVRNRMYVLYPPEGERPPTTLDDVRERAAKVRAAMQER
jgi:hypothetical protein